MVDSSYPTTGFTRNALDLDAAAEISRLVENLQQAVRGQLRRQGAVVGISGGIDSSVVLALCVQAFGARRVVGIAMPEKDSDPESVPLAESLARHYGTGFVVEDLTEALSGFGCYQRRDAAIHRLFPDYQPGWKAKIGLPGNLLEQETLNFFRLTVVNPEGQQFSKRLPPREFYEVVAASNFKQRARMATLYFHAEQRNYAVVGTGNKNEHDLGFFVKYGDGGVDIQPITHLFKTQVYQLARHLEVPEEIQQRTPTTDTYPGGSTQEEFFFRLPFETLDTIWFGHENGYSHQEIAQTLGLTPAQVERVVADILRKQRTTAYLRTPVIGFDR